MRHPIDARALIPVTALHICTNGARTVARLTGLGARARQRAGELIDRLGLGDIVERRVGEVSGGSGRRIDLAASLVGSPSVLFLDEPTTGLDPTARAALWDVVGELNASGTTVVLTTQYLDEADRLADDIVVLDHGRIAARGTPAELKRLVGGKVVTVTIPADDARRCWCCSARCSAPSPTVRTSQPG